MKVCVFGAGAIGSHLALRLAAGGTEVSVVARGAQLAAIRQNGIRGRSVAGETLHASVRASADPADLGPQDAVLVTVKAPALPAVAQMIGPLLRDDTPVAFVMNGIPWWYFLKAGGPHDGRRLPRLDPDDALRNAVGADRVLGGAVNSPTNVIEPGVVMIERAKNYLTLGEPDGTISTRARRLAAAVEAGGNMTVEVTGDIRTAIWNKLISNLSSGPMSVLAMATYRDVFTQPACRAAALRIMQEAAAVARALGCSPETDHAARLALTQNLPHRPSVLQDLELGRPMEVESLMGTTLELARIAGVETPTLDLLVALVQVRAQCAGLYAPAGASPAPASH